MRTHTHTHTHTPMQTEGQDAQLHMNSHLRLSGHTLTESSVPTLPPLLGSAERSPAEQMIRTDPTDSQAQESSLH